ncbi:MAG: tetratricopeptide repeat protein [Chloroflexota bacterium]
MPVIKNLVPHFILDQYEQGVDRGIFQAATLFVDLSGFTPLTAALMQHQKDGAEALANALRTIFTPLVAEVYKRGGLIPLFAGDGFTSIFIVQEEPNVAAADAAMNAARRAQAAGQAIQQWLHGDGHKVQTPYGDFPISATAGLSFGQVQWGIPGEDKRHAFYFRGPAVDGCAQAEHQAEDGEIFTDEQFLAILPGRSLIDWSSLDEYHQPEKHEKQSDNHPQSASSFIHPAIQNLTAPAEFRDVCTLFLSFQEPDAVEQMHAFLAEVMRLVDQYGGIVNQLDFGDMGGYLLLLFGAPISHENDVERAVQFLLALREQTWSIQWRAGLDYGTVWAGIRGGDEFNEYGVAGNVVILACRLFLKAPWDEIWASKAIHRSLRSRYIFDALGELKLKGRHAPQPVYRLLRSHSESTEVGLFSSALVGREQEVTRLNAWITPIFEGHSPGVFIIQGEGGIGKSRLVTEWRNQLDLDRSFGSGHGFARTDLTGFGNLTGPSAQPSLPGRNDDQRRSYQWLKAAGDATHQHSFSPFREGLRRFFQTQSGQVFTKDNQYNRQVFELSLDILIEELANRGAHGMALIEELERTSSFLAALVDVHWADSLYAQVEPQLRFENTLSAIKSYFAAQALVQPFILHLEDLHWFDDDSLQAVQNLIPGLGDQPMAILGTSRPLEEGQSLPFVTANDSTEGFELGYLSRTGVEQLVQQVLQGKLSDELVDFLYGKSAGNPFFAEQLALDLLERDALSIDGQQAGDLQVGNRFYKLTEPDAINVPSSISGVLISRLDRLEPDVKKIVQTASVLGNEFETAVLVHMRQGESNLFDNVRRAHQARIWQPIENGERHLFDHALLRDAAYDMQLRSRLRKLHEQAGQAVEAVYRDALPPQYARLAYHFEHAKAEERAASWYSLAGEHATEQYANEDATRYISKALSLTPESNREFRYQLHLARQSAYFWLGKREAQSTDLQTLSTLAAQLDDNAKRAEAFLQWADYARIDSNNSAVIENAQRAASHALDLEEKLYEARSYHLWGRALREIGDFAEARVQLEQALQLVRAIENHEFEARCLCDIGVIHIYQANYSEALKLYQIARAIYQEIDSARGEVNCLANLGEIHYEQGDYMAAQRNHKQALALCQHIGWIPATRYFYKYLGNESLDLGEFESAYRYYEDTRKTSLDLGNREGEAWGLEGLSAVSCAQGDFDAAKSYAEQALLIHQEIGNRRNEGFCLTYWGDALTELGDLEAARIAYDRALTIRIDLEQPGLSMDNLAGLARVALARTDLDQAVVHVEQILQHLKSRGIDGIEYPIQVYLTCYQILQAVTHLKPNHAAQAELVLHQGIELLQERATKIEDEQLRQSYLGNVSFNRELLALWKTEQAVSIL